MNHTLNQLVLSNSLFNIAAFVCVYETKQTSLAAKTLGVPASKISRSLASLRHTLKDPLFIRNQNHFDCSPLALQLYPQMKAMLALAEQCEALSQQSVTQTHSYTIACPTDLSLGLHQYLTQHAQTRPEAHQFQVIGRPPLLELGFQKKVFDVAITSAPPHHSQLKSSFIASCANLFLVAHEQHAIWQHNPLSLDSTLAQQVILLDDDSYSGSSAALINSQPKLTPIRVADLSQLQQLLALGIGVSIIATQNSLECLKQQGLKVHQFPHSDVTKLYENQGWPELFITQDSHAQPLPDWLHGKLTDFVRSKVNPQQLKLQGMVCR